MLPFLSNKTSYRLSKNIVRPNYFGKFVEFTNLSNFDITIFSLVKNGYGTLKEVLELDTSDIFKIIEFENITKDIEYLAIEEAQCK